MIWRSHVEKAVAWRRVLDEESDSEQRFGEGDPPGEQPAADFIRWT